MPYLQLYGMSGVSQVMPLPIESNRDPNAQDKNALPGQLWVNNTTNGTFIFGGVNSNQEAVWNDASGNLDLASITVTTGPNSIDGLTSINSSYAADTRINTGVSTGAVNIGNSLAGNVAIVSGGTISTTGITSLNASQNFATNINTGTSTGAVTIGNVANGGAVSIRSNGIISAISNGDIAIESTSSVNIGDTIASDINIGTVVGAKTVSVGNADGLTSIVLNGPVTIGTVANTPTITSGAADPQNSVTSPAGSLYLRTNGTVYRNSNGTNTGWNALATV